METKNAGKNWQKPPRTNWNDVDYFVDTNRRLYIYYHNWLRRLIARIINIFP